MDLAAINKIRELDGKEPLTELPQGEKQTTDNNATSTQKEEDTATEKDKIPPVVVVGDLADDKLLEALQKRGFSVNSLDELKPKEDAEKLAEQRDAAVLSYGLTKGKFNKKEYESLVRDSNDHQNLVYQDFYNEAKKEDSDLTDEDIQAEFAEKFGLTAEPGTRKYKRGQQEISILADKLLKGKYQKIYDTEAEYGQYESSQKNQQLTLQKIKAEAPRYKQNIDEIFAGLKKITTKFSDDEVYEVSEVAAVEESLNGIKDLMTNPDYAAQQILKGTSLEDLKEIAFTKMLRDNYPIITKEIVKQALLKHQKGTKGIIPIGAIQKEEAGVLTAEQQKFVSMVNPQPAAAAN